MSSVLIKWPSTFRRTSPNDAKHRRKKGQLSHRLNFESGMRINQSALAPVRRNAIKRALPFSSVPSPNVLPQCSKARTDRSMKRSLALILCLRVGCHRRIARDDNVNWVIRRREARVGDWNATNSLPLFPGQAIKTFGGQLQLAITAGYCLRLVISCIDARVHSPSQVSRHLLISYETWLLIWSIDETDRPNEILYSYKIVVRCEKKRQRIVGTVSKKLEGSRKRLIDKNFTLVQCCDVMWKKRKFVKIICKNNNNVVNDDVLVSTVA